MASLATWEIRVQSPMQATFFSTCLLLLSVVFRHFLLLNQFRAGDILPVTVMAVGSGCSNMKGCMFDKWCWSAVPSRAP